jgi:hypothetical protein
MSNNENSALAGAIRNVENHEAYSIIDELQKDGKIQP